MKTNREKTLVLIKPDGVERGLVGEVLRRFENRGLKIVGLKLVKADKNFLGKHYREDIAQKYGEKVRNGLINYMSSGPVVAIVLEGVEAIRIVRAMCGHTYPSEAMPGTIRGDFCHMSKEYINSNEITDRNIVHASADEADAKIELKLWFKPSELIEYKRVDEIHLW